MLPNDYRRCSTIGPVCPSRKVCQRNTDKGTDPTKIVYAAFQLRREAGSSACDSFIRVGVDVLKVGFEQ